MARLGMVTVDCVSARDLAQWWADRLGGSVIDDSGGWFCMVTHGEGQPLLGFQKVDDPTPGKNKMHLDLSATVEEGGREAAVASFIEAGAVHVSTQGEPGQFQWDVLTDPEGNQFCISNPH